MLALELAQHGWRRAKAAGVGRRGLPGGGDERQRTR